MMSDALAIGVDAGGTKVAAFVVDVREGVILDRRVVASPAEDAEAFVRTIVGTATDILADHPGARVVGVGAAGIVDRKGVVCFSPNVAWRDFPLGERISEAIGLPTIVENDANVAAWGEFRFGAGRGCADMLLVTVGTGIGGGVVVGGELLLGANGFAAEIGHIIVEPGGPECGCGNRGCWEQVASGRAIDRLGRHAARQNPASALFALAAGDPEQVTGTIVSGAARDGDPVAIQVLAEVGRRLGEGIAGLVNVLDPQVVVVGGGAMGAGALLLEPARAACGRSILGRGHRPEVLLVAASMGNDAGAVGAADLAYRRAVTGAEARL